MLHWIKNFRANCDGCPDLEAKITFLEQQLDEYRRRLEEAEKLQGYISEMLAKADPSVHVLFKQIGEIRDAAQLIWTASSEVNTVLARIKEAQTSTANRIAQSQS